jgi:hypothetical protein
MMQSDRLCLEEAALMEELETSFMIHPGSLASCDGGADPI